MNHCGSCGIGNNNGDEFLIAGAYNNNLQLISMRNHDCDFKDDVQVTLPAASYTTADWYFVTGHRENDGGDLRYHSAIARKVGDSTKAILFYTRGHENSVNFDDTRLKEVTLPSSITY